MTTYLWLCKLAPVSAWMSVVVVELPEMIEDDHQKR